MFQVTFLRTYRIDELKKEEHVEASEGLPVYEGRIVEKIQGACIRRAHGGEGAGMCKDTNGGTQEVVFPAQVEHESLGSPPGTPNVLLAQGLPQLEGREGRPKRNPRESVDKGKLLVLTPQGSSFR